MATASKKVTGIALLFLLAGLACGPIGPISGGRLRGEEGPRSVSSWAFARTETRAQLETRPSDPHSVNVWFVSIGPRLYVPSSMIRGPKQPAGRSWVAHVAEDPQVRVRLGDTVFDRVALRVHDGAEYDAARSALEAKYELDPVDRDPEREVWIFRLDALP